MDYCKGNGILLVHLLNLLQTLAYFNFLFLGKTSFQARPMQSLFTSGKSLLAC